MSEVTTPVTAPPNDPNKGRNRAPAPSELSTLRNLRSEYLKDMARLERRLVVSKAEHTRIQANYDYHARELESIKSELNAAYHAITLLQEQYRMIEDENERLQALIHPIRRCPEEILRSIFLWAVVGDPEQWVQTAYRLSHVCQRWRRVALDTSQLWSVISISLKSDLDAAKEFVERTLTRIRTSPAQITIRDIPFYRLKFSVLPADFLAQLGLDRFKSVILKRFLLESEKPMRYIQPFAFEYSNKPLDKLIIEAAVMKDQSQETWLGATLPTVTHLSLTNIGRIYLEARHPVNSFDSLTELRLRNSKFCPSDIPDNVLLSSLQRLEVIASIYPWSQITAPNLFELKVDPKPSEVVIDFIHRHPFIQHLGAILDKDKFKRVAMALPGTKTLDISGFLEGLWNWEVIDMSTPPFPLVDRLIITAEKGKELALEDFEKLVTRRCSAVSGEDHGLKSIKVIEIRDSEEHLENAKFRQSKLLEQCSQRLWSAGSRYDDIGSLAVLTITWP